MALGLLGDHRQRVYLDGEPDLAHNVPEDWATPRLRMNHRSEGRIVALINRVWEAQLAGRTESGDDGRQQSRAKHSGGVVRLFVGAGSETDKPLRERWCAEQMAAATGDTEWTCHGEGYQSLVLEHRMAALRGGFVTFWSALHGYSGYRLALREGDLSVLAVLRDAVAPMRAALRGDGSLDNHAVMTLLLHKSPALSAEGPPNGGSADEQRLQLNQLEEAVEGLHALWADEADPQLGEIVREVRRSGLFELHEHLLEWVDHDIDPDAEPPDGKQSARLCALVAAMQTRWSEYASYRQYISSEAAFVTHQGVKGSEYPRVLVVLDDSEAVGRLFSYDKLFRAKDLSSNDLKNEQDGKETTIDRTLRLFYVACSRARDSLAVVLWSADPGKAAQQAEGSEWFTKDEIVAIPTKAE
ncbi:MAG: Fis family transcriptional regulator, partial [Oligoflexia bacterium]|nr:Fis family transcriptional regulator [Oligoflexia bacterium]